VRRAVEGERGVVEVRLRAVEVVREAREAIKRAV
jgi:hypothetical protein